MYGMQLTKGLLHTTETHITKIKAGGMETTADFLEHFPRTLENRSQVLEHFSYVNLKEKNTIKLTIESIVSERTRNGKQLSKVILRDRQGSMAEAVYFTKPYFLSKFKSGDTVMLYGKAKYDYGKLSFPSPELEFFQAEHTAFVPVYSDCNYIPGAWFADKMEYVRPFLSEITDVLPREIREKKGFRSRQENIAALHFPKTEADFARSRSELAYEELFMIQYRGLERKKAERARTEGMAPKIPLNAERMKGLISNLPFELTGKQKIVLFQILRDMERPHSMARLLQ